jgi:hypothetical protein
MKTCPGCGEIYEDQQRFCQHDDTELETVSDDPGPAAADPGPHDNEAGTQGAETDEEGDSSDGQGNSAGRSSRVTAVKPKPPRTGSAWSTFLKKVPRETLAGIVVVGIILAVILAIFAMRQSKLFRLRVTFAEGHSLSVGDSVFIRGVDVGEVVKAEFEGDRFVASLVIDPKATEQFREDCLFYVGFETIATQKRCVNVYVLDPQSPPLTSGDTVVGDDSLIHVYSEILKRRGPQEAAAAWEELKGMIQNNADALPAQLPGGDVVDWLRGDDDS